DPLAEAILGFGLLTKRQQRIVVRVIQQLLFAPGQQKQTGVSADFLALYQSALCPMLHASSSSSSRHSSGLGGAMWMLENPCEQRWQRTAH
ncbi:hypothetical protein, partial [Lysobacter terrae]